MEGADRIYQRMVRAGAGRPASLHRSVEQGHPTLVQGRIEFVAPVRNWKIDMRFKQVHVPHGSDNIVADLVPIRFAGIAHIQSQVPEPLRFHAISVTPLWRSAKTASEGLREPSAIAAS